VGVCPTGNDNLLDIVFTDIKALRAKNFSSGIGDSNELPHLRAAEYLKSEVLRLRARR